MQSTPRSLRPGPAWSTFLRPVRVLNPLRSEDEAFRFLLYAIAVIVVIVSLILILRAIF